MTLGYQVPPLIDLQSGDHSSDPVKQVVFLAAPNSYHLLISTFFCFAVLLRFLPRDCTLCNAMHCNAMFRPLFRSLWTRCKTDSNGLSSLKTCSTPVSSREAIRCSPPQTSSTSPRLPPPPPLWMPSSSPYDNHRRAGGQSRTATTQARQKQWSSPSLKRSSSCQSRC